MFHTTKEHTAQHSISTATLFAGCSAKQRRRLDEISTPINIKAGYELTHEDGVGREFGVLIDGSATVSIRGETVATLGPGDHFGEVALLRSIGDAGDHRTATVTADCDLWVAVMSVQEFATLRADFPAVAVQLRQTAARRTSANHELTETV